MNITQLNHIALHVENVEASVAFYRDVLGLPPLPRPAFSFPGAWFQLGDDGQELHLIGDHEKPVHSHNRGTHFALAVGSIDDAATTLRRRGVEMFGPKQRPDGIWQIFIQDPDGHYVELCAL